MVYSAAREQIQVSNKQDSENINPNNQVAHSAL